MCARTATAPPLAPVIRVDHADVLGSCASCHNGPTAMGKSADHIPSGNTCDDCHTTTTCAGGVRSHRVTGKLFVLPQRHHRDRQEPHTHPHHQCVRGLPQHHRLGPGDPGRSLPMCWAPASAVTMDRRRWASRPITSPATIPVMIAIPPTAGCRRCSTTVAWRRAPVLLATMAARHRARRRTISPAPIPVTIAIQPLAGYRRALITVRYLRAPVRPATMAARPPASLRTTS